MSNEIQITHDKKHCLKCIAAKNNADVYEYNLYQANFDNKMQ